MVVGKGHLARGNFQHHAATKARIGIYHDRTKTETSDERQLRRRQETGGFPSSQCDTHVPSFCRCGTKQKNRPEDQELKAHLRSANQREINSSTITVNPSYDWSADEQLYGKAKQHWKNTEQKNQSYSSGTKKIIVQSQSDGTKTRSAEPVRAEGKTRRDVVLWDDIARERRQVERSKVQSHECRKS